MFKTTVYYGSDLDQLGDLRVPEGGEPHPVVVLLHGGFWRERFTRELMDGLAEDLTRRGYATWNLEYRRVGPSGGGWPTTLLDVAAGIDHLADLASENRLDLSKVAVVGHSAGGQLALWSASRGNLPTGSPGAGPIVSPRAVISLAGVNDLSTAEEQGLGRGAVAEFLGDSVEHSQIYSLVSPIELLPIKTAQLLVHGTADTHVPVEQSRSYYESAIALGDSAELLVLEGVDHFALNNPESEIWLATAERIGPMLGSS